MCVSARACGRWYACLQTRARSSNSHSDMFGSDTDMAKLRHLPGVEDMLEHYRMHVQGVAESYRRVGLVNASKKEIQV